MEKGCRWNVQVDMPLGCQCAEQNLARSLGRGMETPGGKERSETCVDGSSAQSRVCAVSSSSSSSRAGSQ